MSSPINHSPLATATIAPTLSPIFSPTNTPQPTSTPSPTITPSPSLTPEPTLTPLPTLSALTKKKPAIAFVDDGDALWSADLDGSGEKQLLDSVPRGTDFWVPNWVNRLTWSPNGQWLAVVRAGGLWLVSSDGKNVFELVTVEGERQVGSFAWSPDSKKITFIQGGSNIEKVLAVVDVATAEVTHFINASVDGASNRLVWSPDGQWLAFTKTSWDGLNVINVTDDTVLPIDYSKFCHGSGVVSISWSSWSDRLALLDYGNGRYSHGRACVVTLDGYGSSLTTPSGASSKPFWGFDGELYVGEVNFNPDDPNLDKNPRLLRYDKNGQLVKQLDFVKDFGTNLEISPDGRWLSSFVDGQIQLVNLAENRVLTQSLNISGELAELATLKDLNARYSWAADSQNLVFMIRENSQDGIIYPNYGTMYIFDIQSGELRRITNNHLVRFYEISPIRN
jgi:Tol biopolymer transport system component